MDNERQYIDVVRTMANYAIVGLHSWAAATYVLTNTLEYRIISFICNQVMEIVLSAFFFISGYLLAKGYIKFSLGWWREKLLHRVKRLVVPYLAWNILLVAFYLSVYKVVPRLGTRVVEYNLLTWQGIINKIVHLRIMPIDAPLWFMRTLVWYVLIAIIILPLLKYRKGIFVYILLGVWFTVLILTPGLGNRMTHIAPFYSLLCFVLGLHWSLIGKSPFRVFHSKWWLLVAWIGILCYYWHRVQWEWGWSPFRDIAFILALPWMFTLSPWLVKFSQHIPHWTFIKQSSFFLYASHFLFCSLVMHSAAVLLQSWQGPGKLTVLVTLFCTIGVLACLITYWFGKRYLGRVFSIFDGTL